MNSENIETYLQNLSDRYQISDRYSRQMAEQLDECDELRQLRNQFYYPKMKTMPHADLSLVDPESDAIYLCGNSLGLQPKGVKKYIDEQLDKWANMGVFGHLAEPLPWALCDEYALRGVEELVGAHEGEVALMNGLSVNLHIMMISFYCPTPQRHKILLESKAFPSDHYAIESQIKLHGYSIDESMICLEPKPNETYLKTSDICEYLIENGASIALVMFSGVQYYNGQLFDMETITRVAHQQGCIVGWDLAHAYANVPLELHRWNVDFAVWCSYKYGGAGAGGIAGAFVHSKHDMDKSDRPRLLGWWSHKIETRFLMDNKIDIDHGAAGYRISNPPPLLVCPLLASLDIFKQTSMVQLRAKSIRLTAYLELLLHRHFGEQSPHRHTTTYCMQLTPTNAAERGCQLSLRFSIGIADVYQQLVKRGVACDKRYPDVIRITPVHLYNSFTDVHRFIAALNDALMAVEEKSA